MAGDQKTEIKVFEYLREYSELMTLLSLVKCFGHVRLGGGTGVQPGHTGDIMSLGWFRYMHKVIPLVSVCVNSVLLLCLLFLRTR